MPIRAGAVTFSRFRTGRPPADTKKWLQKSLRTGAFEPIAPGAGEDDRAAGFVELEDPDATGFAAGDVLQGGYALFAWRVDTLRIRGAEVKAELARFAAAFEKEHARPPGKKEKAERKEAIRQALRQKATPVTKVHDVSWNLDGREVLVWAASRKAVEEIAAAIGEAFGVELEPAGAAAVAAHAKIDLEALGPTPALAGLGSAHPERSGAAGAAKSRDAEVLS